jgi:hypothetical protein
MMRAFENRPDTSVVDEPFYAAYLAATGLDHPMRAEVLASQSTDWRMVVAQITGPVPGARQIFYQKHMCHHMLPAFGLDWMKSCEHAFLIRRPEAVLASYVAKREEVTLEDIGFRRQAELYQRAADLIGRAPPVVEAADVLADPEGMLRALCRAVGMPFQEEMLEWPAGRRVSDGVWAPAWYETVEKSTGFAPPSPPVKFESLPDHLKRIAEAARPYYLRLARHRLEPEHEDD